MTRFYCRFRFVLLLALVASPQFAVAQASGLPPRLPGEANPPPGVRAIEQHEAPARGDASSARASRDEAIRELERLHPGSTQRNAAGRGQPMRGHAQPPREVGAAEDHERALRGPARRPPTRDQLVEEIGNQVGGRTLIEEAQRRSAANQGRRSGAAGPFQRYNPLRVKPAWANSAFNVSLTPSRPISTNPAARLYFSGATVLSCCAGHAVHLIPGSELLPGVVGAFGFTMGTQHARQNPYAIFYFQAPQDGVYIINFRGYQSNAVTAMIRANPSAHIQTWDLGGRSGWQSFPVLLDLGRGWHAFSLAVSSGSVMLTEAAAYAF
jgi:hypothetical protein